MCLCVRLCMYVLQRTMSTVCVMSGTRALLCVHVHVHVCVHLRVQVRNRADPKR